MALNFKCTGCGQCCVYTEEGRDNVYVPEEDVQKIADFLDMTKEAFLAKHCGPLDKDGFYRFNNGPGHCQFYDPKEKSCTIYEVRPPQCSSFPFWPMLINIEDPLNLSWKKSTKAACEGCTD